MSFVLIKDCYHAVRMSFMLECNKSANMSGKGPTYIFFIYCCVYCASVVVI